MAKDSPLPIGIADFEKLRDDGCIYVDKTDLIYSLVTQRDFCLLTRPRRFGKSLLLTTLESLFKRGLKYFSDLKIAAVWHERTYKVLRLDFSVLTYGSIEKVRSGIAKQIIYAARDNNIDTKDMPSDSPGECLQCFIMDALPSKTVILIDEYDFPLNNNSFDVDFRRQLILELKEFFTVLKGLSSFCRFIILCGITRNTLTDEYSCLNFLTDISMKTEYSELLGYTDEEIRTYFSPYVKELADFYKVNVDEALQRVKLHYDGYSFDRFGKRKVYNNWSILNLFDDASHSFGNYWYESGFLSANLEQYFFDLSNTPDGPMFAKMLDNLRNDCVIDAASLNFRPDLNKVIDPVLLFYLGYLTIKDSFDESSPQTITLTIPNYEIEIALAKLYAQVVLHHDYVLHVPKEFQNLIAAFFKFDDLSEAATSLEKFFYTFSYDTGIFQSEALLRDIIFFAGVLGEYDVQREKINAFGRSDLQINLKSHRLIFELKIARHSSQIDNKYREAVEQVKNRSYGKELPSAQNIYYVIVISSESKQVVRLAAFDDKSVLGSFSV